jgi:hypothetical protein
MMSQLIHTQNAYILNASLETVFFSLQSADCSYVIKDSLFTSLNKLFSRLIVISLVLRNLVHQNN